MPITISQGREVSPTVNRSPLNNVAAPLGSFGGFTADSQIRSAQDIGRTLEQASEVLLHIEEEDNLNSAIQMEIEFDSFIKDTLMGDGTNENPGYLSTQGYDAVESQIEANVAIEQFAASKIEGAENARIAKLFSDSSVSRVNAASNQINAHAIGQRSGAIEANLVAQRTMIAENANLNIINPETGGIDELVLADAILNIETNVATLGSHNGDGVDTTALNQEVELSDLMSSLSITIAMSGSDEDRLNQIDLARKFINDNRASFTNEDFNRTQTNINSANINYLNVLNAEERQRNTDTANRQSENARNLVLSEEEGNVVDWRMQYALGNISQSQLIAFQNGSDDGDEDLYYSFLVEVAALDGTNLEEFEEIRKRAADSGSLSYKQYLFFETEGRKIFNAMANSGTTNFNSHEYDVFVDRIEAMFPEPPSGGPQGMEDPNLGARTEAVLDFITLVSEIPRNTIVDYGAMKEAYDEVVDNWEPIPTENPELQKAMELSIWPTGFGLPVVSDRTPAQLLLDITVATSNLTTLSPEPGADGVSEQERAQAILKNLANLIANQQVTTAVTTSTQ